MITNCPLKAKTLPTAPKTISKAGRGFTLLELLLVMVIIAVTLGVSNPLLRRTFEDIKLRTASQDITGLIRYAQEQAIVKNAVISLNIDTDSKSYWLSQKSKDSEEEDGKEDSEERLGGRFGRTFYLSEGLSFKSLKKAVDFQPDGQPDEADIEINNANGKSVTISLAPNIGDCVSISE